MDINQVLMDYDNMFGTHSLEEIEDFLTGKIELAMDERDFGAALSLMNEMMSFCRDTSQNQKGLVYCAKVEDMLVKLGLEGTVDYATSLLNVANAYRAFGYFMKSQNLFERVEVIYREKLPAGDFLFAGLYNNWSLLYQETGEFRKAEEMLRRALAIVDLHEHALIQQATTRCNLASTLLRIASGETTGADGQRMDETAAAALYDEALSYLQRALRIFEWDGKRDFHYSAALSAMGDALYLKEDYVQAAGYYAQAMEELEKHVGKTEAYERVAERYEQANVKAEELKKRDSAFSQMSSQPEQPVSSRQGGNGFEYKYNMQVLAGGSEGNAQTVTVNGATGMQKTPADSMDDVYVDTLSTKNPEEEDTSWISVCRRFYETYGVKMLREEFGDYEARIAVGLVGEGSDCFGYEDAISKDHDFELGFCLWLSEEDYRSIGMMLQRSYEQLLVDFGEQFLRENGIEIPQSVSKKIAGRRGVSSIRGFYESLLGVKLSRTEDDRYILPEYWMQITEDKLAAATNGAVFRDDAGAFTKVRESLLEYYPTNIWMMRLAEKLHGFAQTAQSNYARMMARKDYVAANLCVAKGIEYTMEIVYLLNQKYAPYYKWMRKGMNGLALMDSVAPILDKIAVLPLQAQAWEGRTYNAYEVNYRDEVIACFEDIAEYILMELKMQGVVKGTETFMDVHAQNLMNRVNQGDFGGVDDAEMEANYAEYVNDLKQAANEAEEKKQEITDMDANNSGRVYEWGKDDSFDREEKIAEIVEAEWKQFDKVKNEGGRADCQDDWNTFSIMRKSQYMTWTNELLESYLADLNDAKEKGWNLIMEKYARMMQSTAPEKYAELEKELPERSAERTAIAEEIIRIQVDWMEEFAKDYPKMAANARSIHTSEDSAYNTSYETYLRGEIGTYSERTFVLYGRFVTELAAKGGNLAYEIMDNTARLYGYADVKDAEKRL